jgi:hypothetical protein
MPKDVIIAAGLALDAFIVFRLFRPARQPASLSAVADPPALARRDQLERAAARAGDRLSQGEISLAEWQNEIARLNDSLRAPGP